MRTLVLLNKVNKTLFVHKNQPNVRTFAPDFYREHNNTIVLYMKKSFKKLAILSVGIAFISCGQTDVFEQNQNALIDQQKSEYRTNYVQKYGEVSATQSWDFTNLSGSQAKTRAGESVSSDRIQLAYNFWSFINNDSKAVKELVYTTEEKEFNPYLAVDLYPAFSHGNKGVKYQYFHLAACYNDTYTELTANINVKGDFWYQGGSALNHNSGRAINTQSLTTAQNVYWAAYPTYPNYSSSDKQKNKEILDNLQEFKVNTYKEFTVNGRTYWAFRCSEEGDFSDLICLVKNVDPVRPVEKRYFVEDLGSKDDFDFNDIVFDVVQDLQGNQKAIIRAMGGTLDFTLKIGDTEWTKSVDGVTAGYKTSTMYNTQGDIVWNKVLAEFPVTGWNPATNNISVQVKSIASNNVIITIPFPKVGEVPMIIAFDTVVDWQKERVSLPEDWWVVPAATEEEE